MWNFSHLIGTWMTVCIKMLEFNVFKIIVPWGLGVPQGTLTEKYKSNNLSPIFRVM